MNKIIFLYIMLSAGLAQAQLDTMQDRPNIDWTKVESDDFKVIYPEDMNEKAQYILNLLQYYKGPVSETYGINTSKYPVLVRSELASPNGFVSLAPKRSEWFSASAIAPIVSSLEWYQSLAVHEYRHMVQFDYINRPNVNWGYYLFGQTGQAILMGATAPPWYFEGDAVWAETTLTNAGRGRSPRFSARLKSLLINNETPSYDELRGGVYTTVLPNHYVYGYFLITQGYLKYGDKFWARLIDRAARKPYNLYTFYNAFRYLTGDDFSEFYYDTMEELRKRWGPEEQPKNPIYTRYEYPIADGEDIFFLKWNLDSFWELHKYDGQDSKKIAELNIDTNLSKTDLKRDKFVYAQQMPNKRYSYRNYSDIFMLDVESGEQKRITEKQRAYHPQIHPSENLVLAVTFENSVKYGLSVYDYAGRKVSSFSLDKYDIAEAAWLNNEEIIALLLDFRGMRSLARINLVSKRTTLLKYGGRNNIYALRALGEKVYFEADDRGIVSIFEYDLKTQKTGKCTDEKIAAYRPYPSDKSIVYVAEVANGQLIKRRGKACFTVASDFLADIKQYIGGTPSDDFQRTEPKEVKNFPKLLEDSWKQSEYFELEKGLTPHSWSFIGGRGFQLSGSSQNYLNTISATAAVGENADEARPFAELGLFYKKYYPLIGAQFAYRGRNADGDQWSEALAGVTFTLPYIFRKNLYSGAHALTLAGSRVEVSNRENASFYEADDEQINQTSAAFETQLFKKVRYRELQPSWGYSFEAIYINARAIQDESFSSYLGHGSLDLYAPGLAVNHGTLLSLSGEYSPKNPLTYRIESPATQQTNGYAFSRGYDFTYVDSWQKAAFNYIMPLFYPNKSLGRWIYSNRIYANYFYDVTKTYDKLFINQTLSSAGAELFFETLTLRKLPLTFGLRYFYKFEEGSSGTDFLLAINVAF